MSGTLSEIPFDLTEAVRNLITEDEEPVDNILSEKQQRLLAGALYDSWMPPPAEDVDEIAAGQPRPFWVGANVAIFHSVHLPGIVPDLFLSLDVSAPSDLRASDQRSYFTWEHGKAPEAVIEIVSNRRGNEMGSKLKDYARMGVTYYVVFDPLGELRKEMDGRALIVHELIFGKRYRRREDNSLPEAGLSLTLWEGQFEGSHNLWLRWLDERGNLILTGHERADSEADARRLAEERAVHEADARRLAEERAERLTVKLRELGVDPDNL
jgi:Uma2 family endonuclease